MPKRWLVKRRWLVVLEATRYNLWAAAIREARSQPTGVASGLLVRALDCRSKGLEFQSHLQQRFISLPGALSPTPKIE